MTKQDQPRKIDSDGKLLPPRHGASGKWMPAKKKRDYYNHWMVFFISGHVLCTLFVIWLIFQPELGDWVRDTMLHCRDRLLEFNGDARVVFHNVHIFVQNEW